MNITEEISALIAKARSKIVWVKFIYVYDNGKGYTSYSLCGYLSSEYERFSSFEELKAFVEDLPERNEILYRKFDLEEEL